MARSKKLYAVAKGRVPGLYTEWTGPGGAESQVSGFPGAVYKSFPTRSEAAQWLEERGIAVKSSADDLPDKSPDPGRVIVYTDGSSRGNPGSGGWGVVRLNARGQEERSGGFRRTTNNRMELTACIEGVRDLADGVSVLVYSDSQYVVKAVNEGWAENWRARGWMRTRTERAENVDLWARLLDEIDRLDVRFEWVRGHDGDPGNERCDRLATEAASRPDLPEDTGYGNGVSSDQQFLFDA